MKLERYKKQLVNRVSMYIVFAMIAMLFVIFFSIEQSIFKVDFLKGYSIGIALGIELVCVYQITKISKILKNQDLMNELYIKENDEREKLIRIKSGSYIIPIFSIIIFIAAILFSIWDIKIFFTLLVVGAFQLFVSLLLKMYWRYKL